MGGTSASDAPYRGIGYATVSNQPGKTLAQKQLMAIRASRLMAMRDLAEKIHGLNVDAYTSVAEGTMLNDSMRGSVMGLVRDARVVSITPIRSNVYETILEIGGSERQVHNSGQPDNPGTSRPLLSSNLTGANELDISSQPVSKKPTASDVKNQNKTILIGNTIIRPENESNNSGGK